MRHEEEQRLPLFDRLLTWERFPENVRRHTVVVLTALCLNIVLEPSSSESPEHETFRD